MVFDTHIHLNDKSLLDNLDTYIKEANESGVSKFLCVGYDLESSKKSIEIAEKYSCVYASVGIIPTEHRQYDENSISELEKLATSSSKVIAIGEIGLDYYWEKEEEIKNKQKKMFIEQIQLANKLKLPISIHSRDSIQDTFDILHFTKCEKAGIMHCYSGSLELAREFIKLGYCIAFGGTLTFKNAIKSKDVFKNIPLESIVFETDAPYLAPVPYRGKINEPKYIIKTVEYGSMLIDIDKETLENITFDNSIRIFGL